MIRLNQHCTGTPHKVIYPYPMQHKITDNNRIKQCQYNTLTHCRVQLAEQRYANIGATHYRTINLFGIGLPQESHGNPPTPPPKSCNKKAKRISCRYIKEEGDDERNDHYNDDDDDNDDNDGNDGQD